jgi:hypothetical protein
MAESPLPPEETPIATGIANVLKNILKSRKVLSPITTAIEQAVTSKEVADATLEGNPEVEEQLKKIKEDSKTLKEDWDSVQHNVTGSMVNDIRYLFDTENEGGNLARDVLLQIRNPDNLNYLSKLDAPPLKDLENLRSKIYQETQKSLKNYPNEITVYRIGDLTGSVTHRGGEEPLSFSLDPNFKGSSIYQKGNLKPYKVNKKDILANMKGVLKNYKSKEQEVLIRANKVKPIVNKRGGGSVMERNPYDYEPRGI